MPPVDRRNRVMAELQRLGVRVETLPSGGVRLSNQYGHLMTADIGNLSASDLKTFAGQRQHR